MSTLRHSEVPISRIVAGGWQAGRDSWIGVEDEQSIAALRAAFEGGVTTFDTAEDYGDGHSERILAQALGSHRDEIIIATKVSWNHLRRDQIIEACERSLARLDTDRIDLYQVHWPAGTFGSEPVALEESMEALVKLRTQGKIRAIGVSNFDLDHLQHACTLAPIDSLQPPYSLLWRHAEHELLPWCRKRRITVLAYSPLAQGLLTGAIGRDHRFEPGDNRLDNRLFQPPTLDHALDVVETMRPIAAALGVSLAQLSLAWVANQPGTVAIAGARNATQAAENARAGDLRLDPSRLEELGELGELVAQNFEDDPVMWTWRT